MKKFWLFLSLTLLLCAVCVTAVSAAEGVVYLDGTSGADTNTGDSAETAVATLAQAYTLLGDDGGTIVLCGTYSLSASVLVPEHTGTVTITSVYGGVDYRETNSAAFRVTGNWVFRFMGSTELDGLKFVISANKTATIAANYNPLTIGTDVQMVDTDGAETAQMRVTGGPYNTATVPVLAAGESSSLEINGGTYSSILAFSYQVANYVNAGTMDVAIGGNAKTDALWFSVASTSTSYGGTVNAILKSNADIGILYLGGNNDNMYLNGDATVNLQDTASIGEIRYYSWEDPDGKYTSTLNITGDGTSLPAGYGDCFDVITKDGQPYEEPEVNYDVVYVADGGTGDGSAADKPIGSLADAYALLDAEKGGTIILSGDVTVSSALAFDELSGDVTVQAESGAKLILSATITLPKNTNGAAFTFDLPVTATDAVIYGGFRNVTFGENFTVDGTLDFYGGIDAASAADNDAAITETAYAITVKNGTFRNFAGGNSREETSTVGSISAPLTVTVSGGTFTDSFSLSGMSILADNATLAISDGTFACPVYAQGSKNFIRAAASGNSGTVKSDSKYYAIDGDIAVNISGGSFTGGLISAYAVQPAYTQVMRGNFTVAVTGGTFAENTVFDATQVKAYDGVTDKIASITYSDTYTFTVKRFDSVNGVTANESDPIRIAFIGDSITEGYGEDRLTESYPAVFAALAQADNKEILVANYGISGSGLLESTSIYYPDRLAYPLVFEETDADYIVLAMGANDHAAGGAEGAMAQFINNYTAFASALGALPETDKVFVANTLTRGSATSHSYKQIRMAGIVNQLIERITLSLAETNSDDAAFTFVDMYGLTLPAAKAGTLLSGDDLHPTAAGYATMADHFYNAIFSGVTAPATDYHRTEVYVAEDGDPFGSGSAEDPISRLDIAFAMLPAGEEATIHISGTIAYGASLYTPINPTKLTIVGEGTDAVLKQTAGICFKFFTDAKLDNLTLETTVASDIIGAYHDLEMTESVTLVGDWSFYGGFNAYRAGLTNMSNDTVETASSSNDCSIILNCSGSFNNFTLGNQRYYTDSVIGTYSGKMTAVIGDYVRVTGTDCVGISGQNYLTGEITVSLPSTLALDEYASIGTVTDPIVYDATQNTGTVSITTRSVEAPTVVYVATDGTGNGLSADAPVATLTDAYALLDAEKGGTIVICGKYNFTASVTVPAHTGTVTITSVYDGVDYRTQNNAQIYDAGAHVLRLNGPTVIDNLNFVFVSGKTPTIAANFNNLKIGTGFAALDTSGNALLGMRLVGGPYNNTAVGDSLLESGESCTLEVYGGVFRNIIPFSYECDSLATLSHTGTVYMTIGGEVKVTQLWFGITSTTVAHAGATVCTLQDNATVTGTLFMSGSATMQNNGDATLNIQDNASVAAFKYYDKETLFPNTTRTLNITGDNTSLPTGYGECFDVITKDGQPYEEPVVNYDVVFVADGGNGDGTSADAPVATLTEAYTLLNEDGGTVVISGKLSITAHTTLPAHTNAVTITSVYGGVDYRTTNDAQLYSDVWHILHFYGETVLKDLTINLDVSFGMAMHSNPMTVDTGVVINANYDTDNGGRDANGLYIVGDEINGTLDENASYDKDTSITIRSGTVSRVIGFGRYSGARHYEGHSTITVEGTGYVRYLYAGAVADDATGTTATINIREQATVERVHTGGSSKTNYMYGEVIINIDEMDGFRHDTNPDGGKIMEFDTMCIYANKGGVTMYYDASTVPEGALYLAELAKFDHILPACERTGKTHNYGADYANPYGGDAMLRKCSVCEHIEFVGDAPAKVADGVVFVADGGFGDGTHPTFPLGSYTDAMEQLKATGGTIVLIDTVTLAANYEYKFGTEEDCYQEPAHTEAILVTSVYDNVDYRESGAKLVFDGNMNYKTSGTVTFDGIVFDAVDSTGNILAARYNKLVVGKDVTMTDAISLTVVGGYQTFSYTDYVDVYIEDEWLRFSSHAVGVDTFELPDMEYLVMHEDYPTTGFTKEPYARKAAAESFNTMLADMVAATDENGESLGLKYPFIKSAMQSYEHKHDYISRYWARTWREHPEWSWEQVYHHVTISTGIPGYSEHHIGLAVDMWDHTLINPSTGQVYEGVNGHFDKTPEFAWIQEYGKEYGIIQRYPGATSRYVTGFVQEQWHFRYVGPEHAKAIMDTNYRLLEHYVANQIGLFAKDSDVTLLGGTYTKVVGGSNNIGFDIYDSDINLTGKNYVTVGADATVEELTDVDTEKIIGDATGDGKVSLLDILRVLKYCTDETVAISGAADYNGDTVINITDALLILRACLGKGN